MAVDFIHANSSGLMVPTGSVAARLLKGKFNTDLLRPYEGEDGRSYVDVMRKGKREALVTNTEALLQRWEWKLIDEAVIRTARLRLNAIKDLRNNGLIKTVSNGLGKTVYEYQVEGDITGALVSMDGLRQSERDRPVKDFKGLPLPIIHKDFSFGLREIEISRQGRDPLPTNMAEKATRKVIEEAEKMLLGTSAFDGYQYGGYNLYGYTTHPARNTKVITSPLALGWTPLMFVNEVIAMRQQLITDFHYGPYTLYLSPAWSPVLDQDYSAVYAGVTLRKRLELIDLITVKTLDYLLGYRAVLVEMTTDTVEEVIGMEVRVLQWEGSGGMEVFFKVMCMMTPLIYTDYAGNCGIVDGNI